MGAVLSRLDSALRDGEALRLRQSGLTYAAIAEQAGYAGASGARAAVQRAVQVALREPAAEVIALETARLDDLWAKAFALVQSDDPAVALPAIDRALKVMDRRAKLLGLDAPVRVDARLTDATDATIEQLAAEVRALNRTVDSTAVERYGDEVSEAAEPGSDRVLEPGMGGTEQ